MVPKNITGTLILFNRSL